MAARVGPSSKVVLRRWPDQTLYGNLSPYLTEPVPEKHREFRRLVDDLSRVHRRAAGSFDAPPGGSASIGGTTPRLSPVFDSLVPLRRGGLAAALDARWVGADKAGRVTVEHRLRLGRPEGDVATGWTMKGRVRRLTTLHWTPVVVELWPVYEDFARMTMTPQSHVLVSKRYFRLGHRVLDRLWADLAELSAPTGVPPC